MIRQKLRKYELIYLVQPEATDEEREKIAERVDLAFEKFENARVLRKEDWGKRKLAYEIRKFNKAFYQYQVFVGPPGLTAEIERVLRMLDNCMRYLTIKLDEGLDPEAEIIDEPEPVRGAMRPVVVDDDDDDFEEDDDA
ncbi:MAG: 30S ribosomal protein S6 [Myxococcales bacterium]|nr:30S ribosomal protein S6 [Myxococcales bacterium]MCB9545772.1 30S ribosomal protein S6 [Myxococcales bacterium]